MKRKKSTAKILCFSLMMMVSVTAGQAQNRRPTQWTSSKVAVLVKKTVKKDVEKILRDFSLSGKPNRFVGSKGHGDSLKYLQEQMGPHQAQNFLPDIDSAVTLYQNDFDQKIQGTYAKNSAEYKKWDRFTKDMIKNLQATKRVQGTNLIWEKKGSKNPQEILIVGAHYDSIVFDKKTMTVLPKAKGPGANDNGSGVALLLALIPFLSELDLAKTVRVVFFDFEEMGFLGSKAYVESLKPEIKKGAKVLGLINLEMLGHDGQALDKEGKYGNLKLYIRKNTEAGHEQDQALAERVLALGKRANAGVRFELAPTGFDVSDNIRFWQAGLPAVTFSQNWESDFNENTYHTENDIVEAVNLSTLTHSFHFIATAVLALAMDLSP